VKNCTDGPTSCKPDDSALVAACATRDDLFPVVLKYVKGASLARTAVELLFWSQYAKHELKGRKGMYKEDDELGKSLGVPPKTAGRHVLALCATGSKHESGAKVRLFDLRYGPKPKAYGGRVRWLLGLH
jgi:hypothetical protein